MTVPAGPIVTGELVSVCACGDVGCDLFALDYPFCIGCGEHHRPDVGDPCPVDGQRWWPLPPWPVPVAPLPWSIDHP